MKRTQTPAPPTGSVEEWTCSLCKTLLTPDGDCPTCGATLEQNTRLLKVVLGPGNGTKH
jgi:RNA polymerase subunit RPABC4/transcription elongation factor Spt4